MSDGPYRPFLTVATEVIVRLARVETAIQCARDTGLSPTARQGINDAVDRYEASLNDMYRSPEWSALNGHRQHR